MQYDFNFLSIHPKCFDLDDKTDFENFLEEFKFTYIESLVKKYIDNQSMNKIFPQDCFLNSAERC
jgi:hypothetical protein